MNFQLRKTSKLLNPVPSKDDDLKQTDAQKYSHITHSKRTESVQLQLDKRCSDNCLKSPQYWVLTYRLISTRKTILLVASAETSKSLSDVNPREKSSKNKIHEHRFASFRVEFNAKRCVIRKNYFGSFIVNYENNPGRNNGRNFSGIRALTAVKISHRSRYQPEK